MRYLAIAILLGGSPPLLAQDARSRPDEWEKVCREITATPLAEPRFNGPLGAAELPKCNSGELYYGFGAKPDYAAALQCAWYERSHADPDGAAIFPGAGVLMMLYANGRGVARDIGLAKRFACEQQLAAPAETSGRLRHLDAVKDGVAGKPFDLCDDITSGLSGAECADVRSRFADVDRDRSLAKLVAAFTPAQLRRYNDLRAAEAKFEDTRTGNEIDMTGTARDEFVASDQRMLRDQFLINLQRFSRGDIPAATATDARDLDAQMNTLYQKIMRAPGETFSYTTVKPDGIRDTQRAWLGLRDAWMEFATVAYPRLTADRVRAQLIRLRLGQLRRLPIELR